MIKYAIYLNQPSHWILDKGEHTKRSITVFIDVGGKKNINQVKT